MGLHDLQSSDDSGSRRSTPRRPESTTVLEIAPEPDRRRSPRTERRAIGKLFADRADKGAMGREVVVRDLSLDGIGLVSPVALREGHVYALQVSSDWLNLTTRLRIITSRERAAEQFDVGAEFC